MAFSNEFVRCEMYEYLKRAILKLHPFTDATANRTKTYKGGLTNLPEHKILFFFCEIVLYLKTGTVTDKFSFSCNLYILTVFSTITLCGRLNNSLVGCLLRNGEVKYPLEG